MATLCSVCAWVGEINKHRWINFMKCLMVKLYCIILIVLIFIAGIIEMHCHFVFQVDLEIKLIIFLAQWLSQKC